MVIIAWVPCTPYGAITEEHLPADNFHSKNLCICKRHVQTQMAKMYRSSLLIVKWCLYFNGLKIQYHLSNARQVTFKTETFPIVKSAYLLANTRQKICPARPLGTGNEDMLMTQPGVRGRKTPVENKTIDQYYWLFYIENLFSAVGCVVNELLSEECQQLYNCQRTKIFCTFKLSKKHSLKIPVSLFTGLKFVHKHCFLLNLKCHQLHDIWLSFYHGKLAKSLRGLGRH